MNPSRMSRNPAKPAPMPLRKRAFRLLAHINRRVLPKQWHRDLARMGKPRLALVAYRYWVTRNAL